MSELQKATKDELLTMVKGFLPKLKKHPSKEAKKLVEVIDYAVKNPNRATKKDLLDFIKYSNMVLMPVSASSKKVTPNTPKKAEAEKKPSNLVKKSTAEAEMPSRTSQEPQKEVKKSEVVKDITKDKKPPKKADNEPKKAEATKTIFPASLSIDAENGKVNYVLAHSITSMADVQKAIENEVELIFAFKWLNATDVKKDYPKAHPKAKNLKFSDLESGLDLCSPVYVDDDLETALVVSLYTSVPYIILPEDFPEDDDVRVSGTRLMQIYKPET